jgi:hypothetical protein
MELPKNSYKLCKNSIEEGLITQIVELDIEIAMHLRLGSLIHYSNVSVASSNVVKSIFKNWLKTNDSKLEYHYQYYLDDFRCKREIFDTLVTFAQEQNKLEHLLANLFGAYLMGKNSNSLNYLLKKMPQQIIWESFCEQLDDAIYEYTEGNNFEMIDFYDDILRWAHCYNICGLIENVKPIYTDFISKLPDCVKNLIKDYSQIVNIKNGKHKFLMDAINESNT